MAAGDSAALLTMLADDLVVLESGGLETRAEFRTHHLPADIAFARVVKGQQGPSAPTSPRNRYSAQQESLAGSLNREIATTFNASAIVGKTWS